MRFPGLSDEGIKKELDKRTGIARPGPKEFLMDALSFAPALLGMPMMSGSNVIKFPKKKVAKPRVVTPKERYKQTKSIERMEQHYNPDLKNPKVAELPTAGTPSSRIKAEIGEPSVNAITHRELPVKGMFSPWDDQPLSKLRVKSYPRGYSQMHTAELSTATISKKATIKDGRIIPPGTVTPGKETVRSVLPPYWIEGLNKAGKWEEISRYNDLKQAEDALTRFLKK